MPVLIAALVISLLAGLFAPQRAALAIAAVVSALAVGAFVWAVADGKGDDPWWLILVALAGAALNVAACLAASRASGRRPNTSSSR